MALQMLAVLSSMCFHLSVQYSVSFSKRFLGKNFDLFGIGNGFWRIGAHSIIKVHQLHESIKVGCIEIYCSLECFFCILERIRGIFVLQLDKLTM
jgi:hypothetical protein